MTVEIIGGGAIGMLYGARLALSGCAVRLWTRTEEQAERLHREGIRFTDLAGNTAVAAVSGASFPSFMPGGRPPGGGSRLSGAVWIVLAVKQTAIDAPLYSLLRQLAAPDTPVVCLQNGIGHMEKLCAALPDIPFFQAVTTEGALRTGPGGVRHTGAGSLWIARRPARRASGEISGDCENFRVRRQPGKGENFRERSPLAAHGDVRAEAVGDSPATHADPRDALADAQDSLAAALEKMAADLARAGVDVHFSEETDDLVMRKLLVNAVINPLTAVYGVRNGQLPADPHRLRLMRAVFEETKSVLEAARGRAFQEDLWAFVLEVCRATADNESSMLADVKAGRQTEVRWINGGVCELARAMQLAAPLNAALVTLVERLAGK